MALTLKVVQAQSPTSTGTQDVTSAGWGETPVGVIIFHAATTTLDSTVNDGMGGLGAATATDEEFSIAWSDERNADPTVCKRYQAEKVISILNKSGTLVAQAEFTAFISNGVRINWTTVDASNQYYFEVVLIAGSDIDDILLKVFTAPGSTGDDIIDVGFIPTGCPLIFSIGEETAPPTTDNSPFISVGCQGPAGSTEARAWFAGFQGAQGTTNTFNALAEEACISQYNVKSGAWQGNGTAYIKSYNNDGTVTFDWTGVTPGNAYYIAALFVNGGSYKAKDEQSKTSTTGTKAYTGYGDTPRCLWFLSGDMEGASRTTDDRGALGTGAVADVGEDAFTAITSSDNIDASSAFRLHRSGDCVNNLPVLGLSPWSETQAHLDSFDADGYTLDWSNVDADIQRFVACAWMDGAANGAPSASASDRRRVLEQVI